MALFQWGRWYRSIQEMSATDRPDDALLEDDERLDKWFDQYVRDTARKAGRNHGDPRLSFTGQREAQAIEVFTPAQHTQQTKGLA